MIEKITSSFLVDIILKDGLVNRFHAAVYDPLMSLVEKGEMAKRRKELLSPLKGKILEIGTGTGVNLSHYSEESYVIGCEPSTAMFEQARQVVEDNKLGHRIYLLNMAIESDRVFKLVTPASLDYVVCTLVLCSVPDVMWVLRQARKWLKPTGRLVLLEHIKSHNSLVALGQSLATPVWHFCSDGCHLNRPTDEWARQAGFFAVREEYFDFGLPWYQAELKPA